MGDRTITRHMTIEDLVEAKEAAIDFLFKKDIRCIRCGEPIWDTIEEAARKKDFSDEQIDQLVAELNSL